MNEIDQSAIQAVTDAKFMDSFVQQNEFFILKCASSVVHRYISKSDDEWSIALLGFSQAVQDYSIEKGSFMSFAKLIIRRKLIDYIRTQAKHRSEISVNPSLFSGESDEEEEDISMKMVVLNKIRQDPDDSLKLEIEAAGQVFAAYGFSFYDLTACSPKAGKTKAACAKAIVTIIQTPLILNNMRTLKLLPIKAIEKSSQVPRKILDRHRKYIIAAVEIITGDFPCLAEYMRFIREELDK